MVDFTIGFCVNLLEAKAAMITRCCMNLRLYHSPLKIFGVAIVPV
jgi:hypothetical protein